jgi:hypothetical protein
VLAEVVDVAALAVIDEDGVEDELDKRAYLEWSQLCSLLMSKDVAHGG